MDLISLRKYQAERPDGWRRLAAGPFQTPKVPATARSAHKLWIRLLARRSILVQAFDLKE